MGARRSARSRTLSGVAAGGTGHGDWADRAHASGQGTSPCHDDMIHASSHTMISL